MRYVAARHGLQVLIAPVRPTLKGRHPLMPVTIDREADRGEYVEPNVWVRRAGTAADLDFEAQLP